MSAQLRVMEALATGVSERMVKATCAPLAAAPPAVTSLPTQETV